MITFRLQLLDAGGKFVVVANTNSPAQADSIQLSGSTLEQLVRIGQSFASGHLLDYAEARHHGSTIFHSVVNGPIRDGYLAARTLAAERATSLRLTLRLPVNSILNEVPWELMYDGDRFVACHAETTVVRSVTPDSSEGLAVDESLRVLFTSASPEGLEPIDGVGEAEAVAAGLDHSGRDEIVVRHGVSRADLVDLFQSAHRAGRPFHLWHHAGHGRLSTEDERLLLILERERQPELAESWSLAQLVRGEVGLRMAVLDLCFGAAPLGLASHLARLGLPAVIGFRGRLLEPDALAFSRHFYANLASATLDLALARTRQALALVASPLAWAKPQLFTRTENLALRRARPGPTRRQPHGRSEGAIVFENGVLTAGKLHQIGKIGSGGGDAGVSFKHDSIAADEIFQIGELALDDEELFERRLRELSERSRLWR